MGHRVELATVLRVLSKPTQAMVYTDVHLNGSANSKAIAERLSLTEKTVNSHIEALATRGLIDADRAVSVTVQLDNNVVVGPELIAVAGLQRQDDEIGQFIATHGLHRLPEAVHWTNEYCNGNLTRRMAASKMGVANIVGISVTQAMEPIVRQCRGLDEDVAVGQIYPTDP